MYFGDAIDWVEQRGVVVELSSEPGWTTGVDFERIEGAYWPTALREEFEPTIGIVFGPRVPEELKISTLFHEYGHFLHMEYPTEKWHHAGMRVYPSVVLRQEKLAWETGFRVMRGLQIEVTLLMLADRDVGMYSYSLRTWTNKKVASRLWTSFAERSMRKVKGRS